MSVLKRSHSSDSEDSDVKPEIKKERTIVPQNLPRITQWRLRVFAALLADDTFFVGHINEQTARDFEKREYSGQVLNQRERTQIKFSDLQLPLLGKYKLPKFIFERLKPYTPKNGRKFLEVTKGRITEGLEARLVSYVKEHLITGNRGNRVGHEILDNLRIAKSRKIGFEPDNLFHIYALLMFSPVLNFNIAMEQLFLWLVTGARSKNEDGIMITEGHIRKLCELLDAEGQIGRPAPVATFGQCERRETLNLTNVIGDLYLALVEQSITGKFVRPLLPSQSGPVSHDTALRSIIPTFYGLTDLLDRHWSLEL